MSTLQTTKNKIITKFQNKIKESINKYKTPIDFFMDLKTKSYSRIELMIIDSAIKNIPFNTLHNTLLLKENKFIELIQNINIKLSVH